MKNILTSVFLFLSLMTFSQKEIKITTKKCIPSKGFYLKLKNVLNDSRCPEGVTCIWAGEVSVVVEVYKDKQFVEEKTLLFNIKNRNENLNWFQNYYSKKITSIEVLPYPKQEKKVALKKQYIAVVLEN